MLASASGVFREMLERSGARSGIRVYAEIEVAVIVREHLPLRRVWPQVSKRLSILSLYDLSVSILFAYGGVAWLAQPTLPLAMMGAALSLFLVFRNNSAYDRWWEARMLWGSLVNN